MLYAFLEQHSRLSSAHDAVEAAASAVVPAGCRELSYRSMPRDARWVNVRSFNEDSGPVYELGSGKIAVNQACVRSGTFDLQRLGRSRQPGGTRYPTSCESSWRCARQFDRRGNDWAVER